MTCSVCSHCVDVVMRCSKLQACKLNTSMKGNKRNHSFTLAPIDKLAVIVAAPPRANRPKLCNNGLHFLWQWVDITRSIYFLSVQWLSQIPGLFELFARSVVCDIVDEWGNVSGRYKLMYGLWVCTGWPISGELSDVDVLLELISNKSLHFCHPFCWLSSDLVDIAALYGRT